MNFTLATNHPINRFVNLTINLSASMRLDDVPRDERNVWAMGLTTRRRMIGPLFVSPPKADWCLEAV
jgi:hypothetical protein